MRVYLYTPPLEAASGVKHGLAAAQERLIQRAIDCLIGSLIGFGFLLSLGGGGWLGEGCLRGSGVEGALNCFIESGLIDSGVKKKESYRQPFPSLPAWSR